MNPPENQREVGKFRKKPVEVEAVHHNGTVEEAFEKMRALGWMDLRSFVGTIRNRILIEGINGGEAAVEEGEWIVHGLAGNFSACSPDVFEETYEPA